MSSRIAWLVPPPLKGSGGIRVIFNMIQHLCDQGHDCHVFVEGQGNVLEWTEQIEGFYGANDCVIHAGWDFPADRFDLAFATISHSAQQVAKAPAKVRKAYLTQDYEAWFFATGDGFELAEQSYQLGLNPICIGRWLPNVL